MDRLEIKGICSKYPKLSITSGVIVSSFFLNIGSENNLLPVVSFNNMAQMIYRNLNSLNKELKIKGIFNEYKFNDIYGATHSINVLIAIGAEIDDNVYEISDDDVDNNIDIWDGLKKTYQLFDMSSYEQCVNLVM